MTEAENGQSVSLSDAEWVIMQALWKCGGLTLKGVLDEVSPAKGWSKHSVISFLKRMEQKGAIKINDTIPKRYVPLLDREMAVREETEQVLGRVYGGDVLLMVQSAVRGGKLKGEEIDELIGILKRGGDADE